MAGRLIHGDSAARPQSLVRALSEPLWLCSNAAVYLAITAVNRFVTIEPGDEAQVFAAQARQGDAPILYIAWHRYNYVLAQLMQRWPAAARPTLIMHDGLASRALTHESSRWSGFTTFVFARRSPKSPREQIAEYVRESGASILLLPDAGGPYRVAKPGIVELAKLTGAPVLPLSVRHRGARTLGHELRHVLSLPGTHLSLRAGPLIPSEEVTLPRCQRALSDLEPDENNR